MAKKLIEKAATSQTTARKFMLVRTLSTDRCAELRRKYRRQGEHTEHHNPKRQETTRPLSEHHPEKLADKWRNPPSPRLVRFNKTKRGRCNADHWNANEEIPL